MASHPTTDAADERLERLVILTQRLTNVIRKEIQIYRSRRPREAAGLAAEKDTLSAQYNREMSAFKNDQAGLARLSQESKAHLKAVTASFREALTELSDVLGRVRRVSEGIIQAIAADVQSRRATPVGYGTNAAPPAPGGPIPLALNKII